MTVLSYQMEIWSGSKKVMAKGRFEFPQTETGLFHPETRKVSRFRQMMRSDFELKMEMEKQQSEPRQRVMGWDGWTSQKAV
jgi:hypothetical protein